MQFVVFSSPGHGAGVHWSHASASELCAAIAARGDDVRWCAQHHGAVALPDPGARVGSARIERLERDLGPRPPLGRVVDGGRHIAIERELTTWLRARPTTVVVHVGVGALGSPNVLWLADRLGSRGFAIVRGAEVVCHRGDLVDRDRRPCLVHDDAERCRWCCARRWWRRPRAADFLTRIDLLAAGLMAAEGVAVADQSDLTMLVGLGVAPQRVVVGTAPAALLARIDAAVPAR